MTVDSAHDVSAPGSGFLFVGRGPELRMLAGALRRRPAVIMVEGEAGVGKSRLLREMAERESARGGRVLATTCHPLRDPFPFGPVLDALRNVGDWLPPPPQNLNPMAGALLPLLPELSGHLPDPKVAAPDARTERFWLMHGVRAVLDAVSPVVLVVEDLHWADGATQEMLLLLARDPPKGLALILTYRREDIPRGAPVLGSVYRPPPGVSGAEIHLNPLSEVEVQKMAAAALGPRATPHLAHLLFERSAGLPLVAEEDLITLFERGRSGGAMADGDHPVDDAAGLESSAVPRGLREAVSGRVAGLSPQGVAVTQAAAVLAVPAPQALLAEVGHLPPQDAEEGLLEALRQAVLWESAPALYGFRHVLAQQVVYRGLVGPRRLELHRRAIKALWAQRIPPLVQIAHHTRALGDRQAWLQQAHAASEQAIALGDEGIAAGILREMLAEPTLDSHLRSRAALTLSRIAVHSVDYPATVTALRRIVADPQLHQTTRGEIRLNLGLLMFNQASDPAGLDEVEHAIPELKQRPELAARAMAALAMREGDEPVNEDLAWLDRAENTIADIPAEGVRAAVRASRLSLEAYIGEPGVWQRLDALPREAQDPEIVRQTARALYNGAEGALLLGHDARAAALLEESGRLAQREGSPILACYSRSTRLVCDWLAGEWSTLEDDYAALLAEFPDMLFVETQRALVCGRLAAARGERAQAMRDFTAVTEAWGKRGGSIMCITRAGIAHSRLTEGNAEAAWAVVAPALELVRHKGVWVWATGLAPTAVRAAIACGDYDSAAELITQMQRGLEGRDAPAATAELHLCRGILQQDDDPVGAAGQFDRSRVIYQAIGRPYDAAHAAERVARTRISSAPRDAARQVTEAAETYTRLGATSDAARCQEMLRSMGLARPSPRKRRGYGDALSPRETEVAQLLARGSSNKEIAQALYLSLRTVEHHVARTLAKLGVSTRESVQGALKARPGANRAGGQ